MTEEHDLIKDAIVARVGADRMAEGLPCIPDPIYGDIVRVRELKLALERLEQIYVAKVQNYHEMKQQGRLTKDWGEASMLCARMTLLDIQAARCSGDECPVCGADCAGANPPPVNCPRSDE